MPDAFAQIAFTPEVRAEQRRRGSADRNDSASCGVDPVNARLTIAEAAFLEARDIVFQATVGATGWPYVQLRAGRPGFLRVIDPQTVAYADYRGNRQYISMGNLRGEERVSILAIDFEHRRRLKLLGRARITEDPTVIAYLTGVDAPVSERAVVIRVAAFDWNCPQNIPVRRTDAEYEGEVAQLRQRIADLEGCLRATA